MIIRTLICLILLSTSIYSSTLWADWKTEREALDKHYVLHPFRLFYTLEGKNALSQPNQIDQNKNGTPDFIETVAHKLQFAYQVYTQSFGLIDPLLSPRFKNKISLIDIHFIYLKGNGNSGDGIHKLNYKIINGKPKTSLIITLSAILRPENLTPEHELFHSFQYGYSLFKNSWYLEGSARWSEYIFKDNTGSQKKLPKNIQELDEILSKAYGAKYFWRRLAYLCDTDNRSYAPPKNVSQGHIKKLYPDIDFKIYGYGFMKKLFENLTKMDHLVTKKRGFKPYHWRESQKKSSVNNKYILLALEQTIKAVGYKKDQEMQAFLIVLKNYLKQIDKDNSKDLTEYLEDIGTPYQDYYRDGEHIFSRNIWDMFYFDNRLFIGAGNSANRGPSPNSGPVPIISYKPNDKRFKQEGMVDDEKINLFRQIGKTLYIPGEDATENHQFSNFYRRKLNASWQKYRNLPNGLHTFDINGFDKKLFAALGTPKGAGVAISQDKGNSWKVQHLGSRQRAFDLLQIDNHFYAFKQFLPRKKRDKLTPKEQENYFSVAEYKNGHFKGRPDLTRKILFPDTNLSSRKTLHLNRSLSVQNKAVYIGANYFSKTFGVYVAGSLAKDRTKVKRIKLPHNYQPRDILVRGKTIYILCSKEEEQEFRNIVLKANLHKPTHAIELFHFMSSAFARSFEKISGDFYFGLGYNVKSQRKWSVEEINPETGKLLRVKKPL